jgi:hypothetical protein
MPNPKSRPVGKEETTLPAFPRVISGASVGAGGWVGREETGFDAEATGATPISWIRKAPAALPVLDRVSVRSSTVPGATKACSGRGAALSEPDGSAKSSRVVEPGTTVTSRVVGE